MASNNAPALKVLPIAGADNKSEEIQRDNIINAFPVILRELFNAENSVPNRLEF